MTTTTTDGEPDGLPALPAAVEDRLYEILLDRPLERRGPELDALLVHHPECRDAILLRAEAMTAGNAILDRARQPLTSATDPAAADPTVIQPRLPDQIGDYEITGLLGEGGFGTVYRAQQHQPVERTVALKVLHPRRLDERSRWRFQAERQTLARMQHPNIAQMFDAGSTTDGLHYFAMELVDGQPLTRWCDDRRLSLDDRLELFAQVCSAVEHAHQRGVVHRDLKPSNVLVQDDDGRGVPKVIDFGIAKVLETEDGSTLATRDGALIGTPGYMSPEQAASQPVDTRTDVYALGVLLYELLTSDLPFRRSRLLGNVAEVARIVREEDPRRLSTAARQADTGLDEIAVARNSSAGRLLRDLQGDLEWIVRRALAKQPDQRYASVSEFLADIDRFRRLEPVSAREPEAIYLARRFIARHRVGVATSLGLVLGTLAIIAALAWSLDEVDQARRTAEERTRIAVRNEYAAHLAAARAALATGDALSARRHLDAAVPRLRGWEWRYLASQCDTSESTIAGAIGRTLKDIAWLDHERLALIYENGEIVETNTERDWLKISRGRFGFDFQRYCIDRARERMFAIVDHYRTVIAIDLRTWQRTVLFRTDPDQPRDLADIRAIALGHGQRTLAISQNSGIVTLLDTSGTTPPRRLCRADSYAWVMTFSRGDESLLLGTGAGFVKAYRVSDGVLTGNVFVDDEGVKTLVLAEDERTMFASGGSHLRRFDRASGALLQRVDAGCELEELRLSADGQRLYGIGSPGAGQVKSWSTATLELTGRFHGHQRAVRRLDLAPETDRIAAISRSAVRVWRPDPPPPVRQLEAGFNINDLAVAPDGEAFGTSTSTGIARIWNAGTCKLELQIDCRESVFASAAGTGRRDSVFGCALGQDTMWLGGSKLVAIDRATKTTRLGESPPHGISRMAIDPDERWLVAGSVPWGRLFVWQLPAMKLVHDLELPISDRVAFDETRNEFVVAGLGDALYRLDPGSGRVQREQHPGVGKHSLTIRGDLVATGDEALFVGRSGSPLVPMPAIGTITAIAIAHDHQRIATCDANARVTLWDREGTELLVLDDAPKLVTKLAFAANDTRLVGISQLPGAQCFVMVWGAQLPPAPRQR